MRKFITIIASRPIQWLLFWAVSFTLTLQIFSQTDDVRQLDLIYTGLFHLPMLFAVHSHHLLLFKKLLLNEKYVAYFASLIALLAATYFFYLFSFNQLSGWLFPDYFFVALYSAGEITGFTLIYLFAATTIDITRSWFSQQQDIARLARLEEENKKAELQALRAQVNPHFLFNSLNTIYNEALLKTDRAPQLILKLSEMLRYVVDKMEEDKVPLSEELIYLENYVEMHKERLNDPQKVTFVRKAEPGNLKLAPLLLINFVENCFKHADLSEEESFIFIRVDVFARQLKLTCKNTFFPGDSYSYRTGAGLQNAERRLELAYPNRHNLVQSIDGNTYILELNMELN